MPSNPVAFGRDLATGFRAAQGCVSADPKSRIEALAHGGEAEIGTVGNSEHDTITGGHRATTTHRSPERRYPAPRRQPHGKGANTTVQKPHRETKKLNRKPYQDVIRRTRLQHIEITRFSDRHFWHGGYDKAKRVSCRLLSSCAGDFVGSPTMPGHEHTSGPLSDGNRHRRHHAQ
jgi:hypothetical protein